MPKLADPISSPHAVDKAFKAGAKYLTDGGQGGLYIEFKRRPGASVNTGHPWRFAYKRPADGRNNRLTFGDFPDVGIAMARQKAAEARAQLAAGVDPAVERDAAAAAVQAAGDLARENDERAAEGAARIGSFRDYAEQYLATMAAERSATYVNEAATALKAFAYPAFGDLPVQDVTAEHIAAWDSTMALRGKHEMHRKARRFIQQVFEWCMDPDQRQVVKACPVYKTKKLKARISTPRPSVVSVPGRRITVDEMVGRVRALVYAISNWRPQTLEWEERGQGTRHAMLLTLWTAQRITTIASAEKAEFDLDAGVWTIPAAKMKGRREHKEKLDALDHVVYLPTQAVAMLREQFASAPASKWVFPGQRNGKSGHLNRSTVGTRLAAIGMADEHAHSAHGFRALFRTAGQIAAKIDPLRLEAVLAHKAALPVALDGGMRGIYDRAHLIANHDDSLQRWADWLDTLQEGPALRLVA